MKIRVGTEVRDARILQKFSLFGITFVLTAPPSKGGFFNVNHFESGFLGFTGSTSKKAALAGAMAKFCEVGEEKLKELCKNANDKYGILNHLPPRLKK